MAFVRMDLENLVNNRRFILTPPASFKEVDNSLLVYGLPDFSGRNPTQVSVIRLKGSTSIIKGWNLGA